MTYSTLGQHIMNRYGRANKELSVQRQPIRLYFHDEVGLYTVLGRNKHRPHRQDTPNLLAFRRFIDYFAGFSPLGSDESPTQDIAPCAAWNPAWPACIRYRSLSKAKRTASVRTARAILPAGTDRR